MNNSEKQDYFSFLNKWFKINPESIISFEEDAIKEEVAIGDTSS